MARTIEYTREPQINSSSSSSGSGSSSRSSSYDSGLFDNESDFLWQKDKEEEDKKGIIGYLSQLAEKRDKEDTESVHGMSDEEYVELSNVLNEKYGIAYEEISHGNFSNVAATLAEGIDKNIYNEIAASYDSVLDLVLDEKLNKAMSEIYANKIGASSEEYKNGTASWDWSQIVSFKDTLRSEYGIDVQVVQSSTDYTEIVISMVDENGNIIKDSSGKLAQVKKSDNMLPDGSCQNVEKFASAAIDQMGYDCVSITDFTAEEYEFIKYLATLDNIQLGTSSDYKADYLSYKNALIKSTDDWNKIKEEYFANTKTYSDGYTSTGNVQKSKANKFDKTRKTNNIEESQETRIKLSEAEFNKRVTEVQNVQSVTKQEAIEIVSEDYYTE